jgi:hypothetical protein
MPVARLDAKAKDWPCRSCESSVATPFRAAVIVKVLERCEIRTGARAFKQAPGDMFNYSTLTTSIPGNVLVAASAKAHSAYASEKLWEPTVVQNHAQCTAIHTEAAR